MENNDRSLAKALDTAMSKQSVTGLLCTDENGLLVAGIKCCVRIC